jgi:hypothetical protein
MVKMTSSSGEVPVVLLVAQAKIPDVDPAYEYRLRQAVLDHITDIESLTFRSVKMFDPTMIGDVINRYANIRAVILDPSISDRNHRDRILREVAENRRDISFFGSRGTRNLNQLHLTPMSTRH